MLLTNLEEAVQYARPTGMWDTKEFGSFAFQYRLKCSCELYIKECGILI